MTFMAIVPALLILAANLTRAMKPHEATRLRQTRAGLLTGRVMNGSPMTPTQTRVSIRVDEVIAERPNGWLVRGQRVRDGEPTNAKPQQYWVPRDVL